MDQYLDMARQLTNGTFELLCPQMQLVQCPGYTHVLLDGTGLIRSNERGELSFQIVSQCNHVPSVARRSATPHGEIPEPQAYAMLIATDYLGREWRTNWIVPKVFRPSSRTNNWAANHRIEHMSTSQARLEDLPCDARIYFPLKCQLPFDGGTVTTKDVGDNTIETMIASDHHARGIDGANVEFRRQDGDWLVVSGRKEKPFMPGWPGLISQALSFATARTTRPALVTRDVDKNILVGLFSGPFFGFQTHLTAPLISPHSAPAENFWSIIQKFVEFFTSFEDADHVFQELAGIRSGATGSLETACLTLVVGIESLTNVLLDKEPVLVKSDDDAQMKALKKYVDEWTGDGKIRDRAKSILGSMGAPRAVDRLHAFANRTGTPRILVDDWKKLRDRKAHGKTHDNDQIKLDLYYGATELLYRLICSRIGYNGTVSPTSQRDWGVDEWGFPKAITPKN